MTSEPMPTWRAPAAGTLAALAGAGGLLVLVLIGWLGGMGAAGFGEAIGTAAGTWFLAAGQSLRTGTGDVGIVPLGLYAGNLALAWYALRWLTGGTDTPVDDPARHWRTVVPAFLGGYLAAALALFALSFLGPVRPGALAPLGVVAIPILAVAADTWLRWRAGTAAAPADGLLDRVPLWLTRAVRPAGQAAAALLAVGTALVLVMLVVRASTVATVHGALGAGFFGTVALVLGQLTVLPNLGLWALAVLAGPGFTVGEGSSITLGGSQPGLLPAIPVLGAVPPEASYPGWLVLALLVPVGVGVWLGRACGGNLARLTSWRTRLLTSASGAVLAAVLLTAATALGSGALGGRRLAYLGPSLPALALALTLELGLGALAQAGWELLRRRG